MKAILRQLPKTADEVRQAAASMFKYPAVRSVNVRTESGIFRVDKPGNFIAPREIEIETMNEWFSKGELTAIERGNENLYFTNQAGLPYFCKCL